MRRRTLRDCFKCPKVYIMGKMKMSMLFVTLPVIFPLFILLLVVESAFFSPVFADKSLVTAGYSILCPPADHHESISLNKRVISIPKELEEEELLGRLGSRDKQEARTAAVSLALGGNLKAFSYLIEKRNLNLISIYGSYYQNRNRSGCVDPVIEDKIIQSFHDSELREYLLTFFGKNRYQSRKLFDKLFALDLSFKESRVFTSVIRSLVATAQPDIEDRVLEHARRYMVGADLKYWHMFLPIDKYYLDFFVQRNYKPAVQYVQEILDETYYSLVPEMYRTHVYNRHRALYYLLDKYPSYLVEDVFAGQLAKLENVVPDEIYFNIELKAAGGYALRHALSYEGRNTVVQYLSGLLEMEGAVDPSASEKARALIDYKIRSQVIEFLAQAGTRDSGAILVRELNRQAGQAGVRSAASLAAQIVNSLSTLPETVEVDVPEFMKAVRVMDGRSQLFIVPVVLKRHPHPEGQAFLLSQLEDIASAGEAYRSRQGIDSKSAYKIIFDILITFDAADYLFMSRQRVDRMFEKGQMDEKLYISSSKRLNELIGNESALYTQLREEKEAERMESKRRRIRSSR